MAIIVKGHNCERCPEKSRGLCDGTVENCLCKDCPRNMGQCLTTRYCRETESIVYFE